MNTNQPVDALDRLLAQPALPADNGFHARVQVRIAEHQKRFHRIAASLAACWLILASLFAAPERLLIMFTNMSNAVAGFLQRFTGPVAPDTNSNLLLAPELGLMVLLACMVLAIVSLLLSD